jgi:hypothetical protein
VCSFLMFRIQFRITRCVDAAPNLPYKWIPMSCWICCCHGYAYYRAHSWQINPWYACQIAGTIPGQESVSFRTGALVVLASCVHSISKADSKLLEVRTLIRIRAERFSRHAQRIAQALADRDLLNIKDEVVRIALLRSVQTVLQHFSQSVWLAQGARSRTVFNITSTLVQVHSSSTHCFVCVRVIHSRANFRFW